MSSEEFNSMKNKGLLWNLLLESGKFNNISEENVHQVKNDFENKIQKVLSNSNTSSDTLVILNKRLLENMSLELEKYKRNPITRKDVSGERQKVFEKNMETKQNEFKEFINNDKPKELSFKEEIDSPIGTEMEQLMSDAVKRREQQLKIVLQNQDQGQEQNQNKAETWINSDNNNINNVNIKIGDTTNLTDQSIETVEKRVSFKEDTTDFMSQLKVEPLQKESDIMMLVKRLEEKIQKIEENQSLILKNLNISH